MLSHNISKQYWFFSYIHRKSKAYLVKLFNKSLELNVKIACLQVDLFLTPIIKCPLYFTAENIDR